MTWGQQNSLEEGVEQLNVAVEVKFKNKQTNKQTNKQINKKQMIEQLKVAKNSQTVSVLAYILYKVRTFSTFQNV
jgi:hypothetical protein